MIADRRTAATLRMASSIALGLLAPLSAAVAQGDAGAPAAPPPQVRQVAAPAQAATTYRAAPTVRLFGLPAALWAPVSPPYTGTAYRTLGGQAETGADAIAEQSMPLR
jgi:hypothetical protein